MPDSAPTIALLRRILSDRSTPDVEGDGAGDAGDVCREMIEIRKILTRFAAGNLDGDITIRGAVAGCLKTLQANLRHLTWQVQQVAEGDFTQRVDFMGDFSNAFNSMVGQLDRSLGELKESETQLLNLTLEMQDEIKHRRRAEQVLRQNEERWNLAVQCSQDGIWDVNFDTKIGWYSARFLEIMRLSAEDMPPDLRWDLLVHPDNADEKEFLRKLILREIPMQQFCVEYRVLRPDDEMLWVRVRGMPVLGDESTAWRMIGVTTDITLQKETERSMAFRAMHDNLTGLPNRYLLEDRLRQHVAQANRAGTSFILVTLDLDNFKGVNDTWGHAAGDVLLIELGKRIKACLRNTDTAARLGGDEFIFIYTCPRGDEELATRTVLGRLYELFKVPVDLGPVLYTIRSSAGAAYYPEHTQDVQRLFALADEALYQAKQKGKNTYAIWNEDGETP